mgnify:CR=1 FL=1
MKKLGLGKRVLACAASAATLLTGTTAFRQSVFQRIIADNKFNDLFFRE